MPKFSTVRFGELAYSEKDVIHLTEGLVGMPRLQKWLILEMGADVPMKWFQSLDRGDFGFPVSQAEFFHDDYVYPLGKPTRSRLGNLRDEDLATLIITTIHPGGDKVTGNLMAPLVIDTETRRGTQLTLEEGAYSLRQEINYFKFGLAVCSETAENATVSQDTVQKTTETAEQITTGVGESAPDVVEV